MLFLFQMLGNRAGAVSRECSGMNTLILNQIPDTNQPLCGKHNRTNNIDGLRMDANKIQVVGVPWGEKSSFMRGCADAPNKIWDAFTCESANTCAENGHDLGREDRFAFSGNMPVSAGNKVMDEIAVRAEKIASQGIRPLFLGGDHAVTYPLIKGMANRHPDLSILHFDAHPDLYDDFEGHKYYHGSPFARIMENGLANRLVSVGIRTMNPQQKEQAERFGVEIVDMIHFDPWMEIEFHGPVYLSLDLDVLDPAFAPGISHHEPGGLTTRELIRVIQNFKGRLVGADIVEYNPYRDIQNVTAMVAAKLMKEVAARLFD
jgi:agmatinase